MGYESVTPSLADQKTAHRHPDDRESTWTEPATLAAVQKSRTMLRSHSYAQPDHWQQKRTIVGAYDRAEPSAQLVARRNTLIAAVRIAFGVLWACDAWFKWQPAFITNFAQFSTQSINGQPPVISAWLTFWSHVVSLNAHSFAHGVAIGETCIALCLIFGAFTNLACSAGILLTLLSWATLDGLGGLFGRGSIDIGLIIVYVLVFLGLILSNAGQTLGVDRSLSTKLGRWTFLATGPMQ